MAARPEHDPSRGEVDDVGVGAASFLGDHCVTPRKADLERRPDIERQGHDPARVRRDDEHLAVDVPCMEFVAG